MMGVPTTERTTAHLCIGDVMRSTQYYGQTRRFVVVDTTPKTVRVREIRRWGLDDLAYLEDPALVAAGAYAQDFPW